MSQLFKHVMGQQVAVSPGNEVGKVVGRAEYEHSEPSYLLRYVAGDGRSVEQWWGESALSDSLPLTKSGGKGRINRQLLIKRSL